MRIIALFPMISVLFFFGVDASAAIIHNSSKSNYSQLAGEPIPGLDVLLDQRPGGIIYIYQQRIASEKVGVLSSKMERRFAGYRKR